VALAVGLSVLGSLLYLQRAEKVYEANAQVLVQPVTGGTFDGLGLSLLQDSADPTRPVQTIARLVETSGVANRAARRVGDRRDTNEILAEVQAKPIADSSLVDIAARAPTARQAQRLANAFAAGLVDDRTQRFHDQIDRSIATLQRQGSTTGLARLRALREAPDPTVSLETPAELPTSPVAPRPLLTLMAALLAGLVLGITGALLLELLVPRVRRARELRERFGLPVLTDADAGRSRTGGPLSSERAAMFRPLRLALMRRAELAGGDGRAVVVTAETSAAADDVAAGLAAGLASAGEPAVLVQLSAEGRRIAAGPGVYELLAGVAAPAECTTTLRPGDFEVDVIPRGSGGEQEPSDRAIAQLLDDLSANGRWVVISAPATTDVPQMLGFAISSDEVVVAVPRGDRARALESLVRQLEEQSVVPAGFALYSAKGLGRGAEAPEGARPVTVRARRREPALQGDPRTPGGSSAPRRSAGR
jgi:capsular polysaccharide biosynthesis protein